MKKILSSIGLMSGTSADGIDVAYIQTDGEAVTRPGPWLMVPYDEKLRKEILKLIHDGGEVVACEQAITEAHAKVVKYFMEKEGIATHEVDIIGFHGQTIFHAPERQITWQLGDSKLLAKRTGIPVIGNFRYNDIAHGGEGAPLVPVYHHAITMAVPRPVAIVNIGGVANVTWIGEGVRGRSTFKRAPASLCTAGGEGYNLLAFDTGPGNALVDDWVYRHRGVRLDEGGKIAAKGKVHEGIVEAYLQEEFFMRRPPKSLDRQAFTLNRVEKLSLEDGAATLVEVTVRAIARAQGFFPSPVSHWYLTGGGRRNAYMMKRLKAVLPAQVNPIEVLGYEGDALEAQAFAYLAVRVLKKLPLTFSTTTGIKQPMLTGGVFYPV